MGNSRLNQVSGTIQFVIITQIGEPRSLTALIPGVDVAIICLRGRDEVNHRIQLRFQRGIWHTGQAPAGCFHPLVGIGIDKDQAEVLPIALAGHKREIGDGATGHEAIVLTGQ